MLKEAMDALHKANPMISYQDILLQYAAWSRMISEDRLHFPYFRKGVTLNGSALLRYAMIISVQKLTEVIKSNTAGFLRIQRHKRRILSRILKRPLKMNWD